MLIEQVVHGLSTDEEYGEYIILHCFTEFDEIRYLVMQVAAMLRCNRALLPAYAKAGFRATLKPNLAPCYDVS